MVGQAAVARHLGDLVRARGLLDTAADRYRDADFPAGQARVLAGLAWWALGADQPDAAASFAADAVRAAEAVADPETQLLADSALAAANCDRRPHAAQCRQLRRTRATASRRSGASLAHRRARSAGALRSSHADGQLTKRLSSQVTAAGPPQTAEPFAPQPHLRTASAHTFNLTSCLKDPINALPAEPNRPTAGPAVEDHGRAVTANTAGRRLLPPSAAGQGDAGNLDGAPSRRQRRSGLPARRRRPRRLRRSCAPRCDAADR